MYSSGSPEGGSDSSENRGEFLDKLARVRGVVKPGSGPTPILSSTGSTAIAVGNWVLTCRKEGEMSIRNADGQQQATVLREDVSGFVFPWNSWHSSFFCRRDNDGSGICRRNRRWRIRSHRRAARKKDPIEGGRTRAKVRKLAREVYEQHFRVAEAVPRGVVATLRGIVSKLEAACEKHGGGASEWREEMCEAFAKLSELITDEHAVSAYELHSSGLVPALLTIL